MSQAPRVLYVDDEAINQCIATEILLALGAVADTASDGLQALHLIRTGRYALIVTDVEMPVMDGATLTHILRRDSRYERLPIIACTAISRDEEEKKLLEQGFSAVLRKPFDADALRDALARFAAPAGGEAAEPSGDAAPFPAPSTLEEKDIRLPGFSVPEGLARVMGNVPLYVSLLFDFRRELANASADIRRFRRDGDMASILAAIHKLKGVSGNVGATELYSRIVDAEPRLRGNAESVEKHLDTLERYVTTTLAALTEAEKTLAAAEPPRAGQDAEGKPDIEHLRPALAETLRFVRRHDTAARDAFEEARPFLGASVKAQAFDIQQSLDSFDFDKAESSILHLARTLEVELEESDVPF